MKYCIEEDYNQFLNLFFEMQKQLASNTIYILVVNEMYIVGIELSACGKDTINIKFKISEDPKNKSKDIEEYDCVLLKTDFDSGIFKINVKNEIDTVVELEIIELLTEKLYNYNSIRDMKGI